MPIGFSSAPRNLFLFGSAGTDVVTNFFKTINQSAGTDEVFVPDEIRYNYTDQKYILAGSASDSNSKSFGWFEKRNDAGVAEWDVRVEAGAGVNTTLRAMELDGSNNLIVVGESGNFPWIAKYSNGGVIDWQATTFSGNVTYTGVASDSNGNYYACGNTPESGEAVAFVEKYATNGTPDWSKSAFMLGRDVVITSIDANSRGEVIAVGYLEDDSADKGYIIKIDTTTGDVMWDRTLTAFGGGLDAQCTDVFIDTNDQIYVTASSNAYGYLLKYTAEGNMIWQKRSNQPGGTVSYDQVYSDGGTEQTIVFAKYNDGSDTVGVVSKYTKNGDLIWRRTLTSSFNNSDTFANLCLDADPSFYYFLYTDSPLNVSNGTPDKYTFGKVSSSGNGLGSFQYDEGTGQTIDYEIVSFGDIIGRLSDGSVTNSVSDLMTYPFTANKLVFDDLATHVSNKKRQMDSVDSFEYDNGSAIRIAPRQELNLLGNVYSGSGDWLDQSGKGNDATTLFTTTTTTTTGGTTSSENFGTGGSITYNTYGTVVEGVTATLPYSTSGWDHYDGKVRDLQSGGFKITTSNSATNTFFMGCWVKFETYAQSRQMGINLSGNYIYWETLASGKVGVRHNGGNRQDSTSGTGIDDGNWHYISLSRNGSTLSGHVDGTAVVSTTSGVSGNSVPTNADFWFFGGSGTSYNIDGKILDPIINIGTGQTGGYTTPTNPIIDSSGNFNGGGSGSGPFFSSSFEYASPAIALAGSTTTTTTTNGPTYNAAGYFEFDGTNDYIDLPKTLANWYAGPYSIEMWFRANNLNLNSNLKGPLIGLSDVDANEEWWSLGWNNSSVFNFYYWNGSQQNQVGSTALSTATWYHAVFTHDSGTMTLYLNGSQDATGSVVGTPQFDIGSVYNFTLGASASGYHNGEIGEVRVYPRVLTAAQVFQNYNATKETYTSVAASTNPGLTSTRTP